MLQHDQALHNPRETAHDWFTTLKIPVSARPFLLQEFGNQFPDSPAGLLRLREKIIAHFRLMDESSPYSNWADKGPRPQAATHLAIENKHSEHLHTEHSYPAWDETASSNQGGRGSDYPWNEDSQQESRYPWTNEPRNRQWSHSSSSTDWKGSDWKSSSSKRSRHQ